MKVQIANPNLADEIISSLVQQDPAINTPEFVALRQLNRRWQCAKYNQDGEPWLRVTNHKDIKVICDLLAKHPELLVVVPSSFIESIADEKLGLLTESDKTYCRKQAEILESTTSEDKRNDVLWRIASAVIDPSELIGQTLKPHQRDLCTAIARNILN
jgi:hypothetical protein